MFAHSVIRRQGNERSFLSVLILQSPSMPLNNQGRLSRTAFLLLIKCFRFSPDSALFITVQDGHWRLYSRQCYPCINNFDFIVEVGSLIFVDHIFYFNYIHSVQTHGILVGK